MTDFKYFSNSITQQCATQGMFATFGTESEDLIAQGFHFKLPLLHRIGETCDWRIVLLATFLKKEQDNPLFENMRKNLEIAALKFSASRCRADRLPELAYRFFNDSTSYAFAHLCADVERIANSGSSRNCQSYETALFRFAESHKPYKNVPLTKYLLWHYEAAARKAKGVSELTDERYIKYSLITLDEVFQNPSLSPIQTGIAGYALVSKVLWFEIRDAKPEQKPEVLRKSDLFSTREIFHNEGNTQENNMERNHRIREFINHYVKIQHTTHI